MRAADIIEDMIKWIVANQPEPVPQQGEGYYFPRRKPEEGNIAELESLEKLYDYIRMLDAEGYPRALLDYGFTYHRDNNFLHDDLTWFILRK